MRSLLDDAGLRARLGIAGAQRAASRYTWRHVADATLGLYASVIEGRRR